jgi:hypothetical protein
MRITFRLVAVFAFIALFLSPASATRGDESGAHQIGWEIGAGCPQYREDILTPLRWIGIRALIGGQYRYLGSRDRHQAFLAFSMAYLDNRFGDGGYAALLDIDYRYHRKVLVDESMGELWLGPALRYMLDDQFYHSWDTNEIYWLTTLDLGPSAAWHALWGKKHDIWVELQLPLLALASRPPRYRYHGQETSGDVGYFFSAPNAHMKVTSLHEYISIRLKAEYLYKIGASTQLGGTYEIGYRTDSEPVRFQELDQTLAFKMMHTL